MKINIAIDGPSAAGKSTIANILADRLGYTHLDTGAMYRAVGYNAIKNGIALDDEENIVKMIESMDLKMNADGSVVLDGVDISNAIRENEISMAASDVSKHKNVRSALVAMQQKICENKGYILDGRDIGTVVLKDAELKIFLTASAESRARRRCLQNEMMGIPYDYNQILEDIEKRDYQDTHRENSPLTQAKDAIVVDSSDITIDEEISMIMRLIEEKIK